MQTLPGLIKSLASFFVFLLLSKEPMAQSRPVDVVFCMDLSGSTNGLMDDLRDHFWDIAEQFRALKPEPFVRIGFVGYSRPSFGKGSGYSKIISPLTSDFEQLSYDLFSLKPYIEKGDQMVGSALQLTVKGMNWNRDNDAVRMIFLVGNGAVSLGSVDFREPCEEAAQRGICIYPVYCTKADKSKEITGWLEIARMTGTEMKEISIHGNIPVLPVSASIQALQAADIRLMKTYICYGDQGFARLKISKEADNNAFRGGFMSFEARMNYKIRFPENAKEWDLVDYLMWKGDLPEFDHNTLADTLKMIPDDNLKRTVLHAKNLRNGIRNEMDWLIPDNRRMLLKMQLAEKQIEKLDALEFVVVETYQKNLQSHRFTIE